MNNITHVIAQKPPEFLFCAVDHNSVDSTFKRGLKRKKNPFIVLYENEYDAKRTVRKLPFCFVVLAELMADDGYVFAHAETGEWIVDEIPAKYLRLSY